MNERTILKVLPIRMGATRGISIAKATGGFADPFWIAHMLQDGSIWSSCRFRRRLRTFASLTRSDEDGFLRTCWANGETE